MDVAWDRMVVVGRIARPHGLKGHVIIDPETDFVDERYEVGRVVYVRRDGRSEPLAIATMRLWRGRPIVQFEGIDSIEAAGALAGLELGVPPDDLHVLGAGRFYRHDLLGCAVVTRAGDEVGVVVRVDGEASGARLVVRSRAGDETLIPFAAEICVEIDPAGRRLVIEPIAGLLDLNRSPPSGARS
jgi:16S rRNA processing protein RimM